MVTSIRGIAKWEEDKGNQLSANILRLAADEIDGLGDWKQASEVEAGLRRRFQAEGKNLFRALEHVTELLVDTWATAMPGDPEKEIAVIKARAAMETVLVKPD